MTKEQLKELINSIPKEETADTISGYGFVYDIKQSQYIKVSYVLCNDVMFWFDGQEYDFMIEYSNFDKIGSLELIIFKLISDKSEEKYFMEFAKRISKEPKIQNLNIEKDKCIKSYFSKVDFEKIAEGLGNFFNDKKIKVDPFDAYKFKRHLMFIGEKGSGKTYSVYQFLEEQKLDFIFVGGNIDIEAVDLKGMLIPYEQNGDREFKWIDGPLTQAFRRASKGEKIVLFIEEILRISPSGISALISSLSTNNKDQFVLNTGRIIGFEDGVGITEVLVAPRKNLWVLSTTNIGVDYDVSHFDEAFADRFEMIETENEPIKTKTILRKICAEKGGGFLEMPDKLMAFYKSLDNLSKNTTIKKPNMRHLIHSIEDSDIYQEVPVRLKDKISKWAQRDIDGKLINEQVDLIEKSILRHF